MSEIIVDYLQPLKMTSDEKDMCRTGREMGNFQRNRNQQTNSVVILKYRIMAMQTARLFCIGERKGNGSGHDMMLMMMNWLLRVCR